MLINVVVSQGTLLELKRLQNVDHTKIQIGKVYNAKLNVANLYMK